MTQPHTQLTDERGQTLTEYALVLSLVAAGCVLVTASIGATVLALFNQVIPGFP